MNGYERIITALQRKQPDRIPIMELSIHPKVIEGLSPGADLFQLVEEMDLDAVCIEGGSFAESSDRSEPFYDQRADH